MSYLHAKSVCDGGEYLTFVSLLMSHVGLEIFPDKQQRVKLRLPKEQRVLIAKQMIEEEAAGNQPAVMFRVFGEKKILLPLSHQLSMRLLSLTYN
jgi:hypothetical protein